MPLADHLGADRQAWGPVNTGSVRPGHARQSQGTEGRISRGLQPGYLARGTGGEQHVIGAIIWSQISVDCSPEPFPLQSVACRYNSKNNCFICSQSIEATCISESAEDRGGIPPVSPDLVVKSQVIDIK